MYFTELEQVGEKIDIYVNNAGIGTLTPIFEEDDQNNFESIIQMNLMGMWYVTKAVANHIKNITFMGQLLISAVWMEMPFLQNSALPIVLANQR